ncbi:MAG: MarC family protein [Victivallales bacterium]|nr:MarC family protein [Victivallales bacterium]
MQYFTTFFSNYLNFFFLLTPFFVLSTFISLTEGLSGSMRRKLARKVTFGIIAVTLIIFWLGTYVMRLFDITVDAFRAGSGVLLLLTAISLVLGKNTAITAKNEQELLDMAVVPLAVPITAGPATLGMLMVLGTTTVAIPMKLVLSASIIAASVSIGVMLALSDKLLKWMGHSNIAILSKVTGLILAAIAMQMITIGVKDLWMK